MFTYGHVPHAYSVHVCVSVCQCSMCVCVVSVWFIGCGSGMGCLCGMAMGVTTAVGNKGVCMLNRGSHDSNKHLLPTH